MATFGQLSGVAFVTGAGKQQSHVSRDWNQVSPLTKSCHQLAGGIGSSTALAYAHAGVSGLYLTDLESAKDALAEVAKQCQEQATNKAIKVEFASMDVRNEAEVDRVVGHAKETLGRIDYAANIAGVINNSSGSVASSPTN